MIIVNGEGWDICLVPHYHASLTTPEGTQALGCCDDYTKTIYIDETLHPIRLQQVLCHEITHAAMYSYDVPISDPEEEMLATLMSIYGAEIVGLTNMVSHKLKL